MVKYVELERAMEICQEVDDYIVGEEIARKIAELPTVEIDVTGDEKNIL